MHATAIVSKILTQLLPPMHATRRAALIAAVSSAVRGHHLAVTALGRGLQSAIDEKHQIKRIDRLLSNPHLQAQCTAMYRHVAGTLIGACPRPVIAVDWSDLDGAKRHFLLRAALVVDGRTLTLYEEVHTLASKEKRRTHRRFLQQLHALVPMGARPILVTDAGFRTVWFKQVLALGWDYVGRVRNRHLLRRGAESWWWNAKTLYAQATAQPKDLGRFELTRSNPLLCRLVVVRRRKRGRRQWTLSGQPARSIRCQRASVREREPWLLATSLSPKHARAKRIVALYATRMQVEEGFRDVKSARFGLGFEVSRSRQTQRIVVLLLIAMLTLWVAWLLGMAVELRGQQRRYQANTEDRRRVLSIPYLGRRAIHDVRVQMDNQQLAKAVNALSILVGNAFKTE